MNEEKVEVTVTTQVETFEQAKELLDDLEVLNKKYEVNAIVSIYPRVNFEAFDAQT